MSVVWRATHLRLNQPVAVKFLRKSGSDQYRERFLREAQVVAAIRHRHVVDVLDVGVEQGWVYIVMELLEGQTLTDYLIDDKLNLPMVIRITAQVLGGLTAVHDAGMIHRDVKPENIVLVEDADGMYPKLLDFGVSKSALLPSESGERRLASVIPTEENMIVGTPEYMSPEQIRGERALKPSADVYSMGALLYEMLTGARPHSSEGMTAAAMMIRVATQEPRPLSDYRPDLPAPLAEFVMKAMARNRDNRFPHARAMRRALIVATGQTAHLLEDTQPELAEALRQSVGAAYEPGDSAVIYVGKTPSTSDYPAATTLDDLPPVPKTAGLGKLWFGVAAFALIGLVAGVGLAISGESTEAMEPPAVTPAPVSFVLQGLVPEAEVRFDGERMEGDRWEVPRSERVHRVEVSALGYETWSAERTAAEDRILEVALTRVEEPEAPTAVEPATEPAAREPDTAMTPAVMTATAMRPSAMRPSAMRPSAMRPANMQPASMSQMGLRFRDPGF